MKRIKAEKVQCSYDDYTDVMYTLFGDAHDTVSRQTPMGFLVTLSRPEYKIVGVTIMDFLERFGLSTREICVDAGEVDAGEPFVLELPSSTCLVGS